MGSRQVLIFYSIRNTGHHAAARALGRAFGIVDGEVDVSVMNLAAYTNPIMERLISNLFVQIMKRRPGLWGSLYNSPRSDELFVQFTDFAYRRGIDRVSELVEERLPGAIICTQCLPCSMVDEYKRKTGSSVPLVAVVTDFFIPQYWIFRNVDLYLVPNEDIMADAVRLGVPPERVRPLGIPIDPVYGTSVDRIAVRARLGLDPEKALVLVVGGGSGIGLLKEISRIFMEGGGDIQVIVITGRNSALKQRLRKEKQRLNARHVIVLGYVRRMNELMGVADLIITKPGGLTIAESMAKGVPVIALSPLPGQEERNLTYLADRGLGYGADNPKEAVCLARDLLDDDGRLSLLRRRALAMGKLNSAVDAATVVMELIDAPVHTV